jgi:hypothetical protein
MQSRNPPLRLICVAEAGRGQLRKTVSYPCDGISAVTRSPLLRGRLQLRHSSGLRRTGSGTCPPRLGDAGCPLGKWARPPGNPGGASMRKSLSRVTAQPAAAGAEATASSS